MNEGLEEQKKLEAADFPRRNWQWQTETRQN